MIFSNFFKMSLFLEVVSEVKVKGLVHLKITIQGLTLELVTHYFITISICIYMYCASIFILELCHMYYYTFTYPVQMYIYVKATLE